MEDTSRKVPWDVFLCRQIDLLSIVLKAKVGMGASKHWDKTNIHPLQWSMNQFLVLYPAPGRSFAHGTKVKFGPISCPKVVFV